ncbi:MAG: sialate O-acetylesterase [Oscillospiraceae bacterium]|nr:sialate O-acetylesterase [Oscillospiraceae bacterium]
MSLKLSPLYSDNMVLQRDTDLIIHGTASPGEAVNINFIGGDFSAKTNSDGEFNCSVGNYPANSQPQSMTISTSNNELVIRNILIGDVWLCSGQSNMEMLLDRTCHNYPDEMVITNPLIRQLKIPQVYNFSEPQKDLPPCNWEGFSPETAWGFTAVGYFFAKKLQERYNVPIGLLACAVGGVPVVAFMSRGMLKEFPEVVIENPENTEETLQLHEEQTQDYHERLSKAEESSPDTPYEEVQLCEPAIGMGVHRYRKVIDLPEELWGQEATIFLGTAVDMDEVFINGERIGAVYYRYPPREYKFTLPKGKLTIEIRLLCFGEKGGFTVGKNYFIATPTRFIDIDGTWERRFAVSFESPPSQPFFQYKPTGLYNGMVSPLSNYGIKGVIWYQGETDTGIPEPYSDKLCTLIKGWRELFKKPNLPFLMTQLTYYDDVGGFDEETLARWEKLRERQKRCLDLPNTGLAAAYDLGEHNDIHPQNKRDVGERLARLAMRTAYGETLPPNVFEMYNVSN